MEQDEFGRWESRIHNLTPEECQVLRFCVWVASVMERELGGFVARAVLTAWLADVENLPITLSSAKPDQNTGDTSGADVPFPRWLRDVGNLTDSQLRTISAALSIGAEVPQVASGTADAGFLRWLMEVRQLPSSRQSSIKAITDVWLEKASQEESTKGCINRPTRELRDSNMDNPKVYRGNWAKSIGKTAKYSVRHVDGESRVTIFCDLGNSQRFLAIDEDAADIADRVNRIKRAIGKSIGGVFYLNEYHHLVVPVRDYYYFAGKVSDVEFSFTFGGRKLTTKPVNAHGEMLNPGDEWIGPRPGILYRLAAGGSDIYYETPALTNDHPPQVKAGVTSRVYLSKAIGDRRAVTDTARLILDQRSHLGGRFYVNEHRAVFTPVAREDGLNYIYCGQLDLAKWFPEPLQDTTT